MNILAFTITATIIYVLFFMDNLYEIYETQKRINKKINDLENDRID